MMSTFTKVRVKGVDDYKDLYLSGYYPYYDRALSNFYWMRDDVRAVIDLTDDDLGARVERVMNSARSRFSITENTATLKVIDMISCEDIKKDTWVFGEVVSIYKMLFESKLLHTIEAWEGHRLVGALLGINLHGVYLAETMFSVGKGASKQCLCDLVHKLKHRGFSFVDVQNRHPQGHPASRLGEKCLHIDDYLVRLRRAAFSL